MALKSNYFPDEPETQIIPPLNPDISRNLAEAIQASKRDEEKFLLKDLGWRSLKEAYFDNSPIEPFLIGPGMVAQGNVWVIGGAPKAGKTDFMLHMFSHFADGRPFLKFVPTRILRTAYIQCEVTYNVLRMRMKFMGLPPEVILSGGHNLMITEKFDSILTEENLERAAQQILNYFPPEALPDLIAIDPLRNVFDGGEGGKGENDNDAMTRFIKNTKVLLRDRVNPKSALVIAHHTRKISAQSKAQGHTAVFDNLSGASALRSLYDVGTIISQEDESDPDNHKRHIYIESRNSIRELPEMRAPEFFKTQKNSEGAWEICDDIHVDEDMRTMTNRKDRDEKNQVVIDFIFSECKKYGRLYTKDALAKMLEDKFALGSAGTISARLDVLIAKWYIKFTKEAYQYGDYLQSGNYLVVYDMVMPTGKPVVATHTKSRSDNQLEVIRDAGIWDLNG